MRRVVSWLDDNILTVLAGFLLVFIPLYPKLPLADIIPGYLVRLRLEDLFIALAFGIYFIQVIRRKVKFSKTPVVFGIGLYLLFGLLSSISAVYIVGTVPAEPLHMEKTFLHLLRRLEYFSLFFVLFSAIRSAKTIRILLVLFFAALVGVILYGYGQKYLYWPAFSTMNREFAKGWLLYLTEHARVLSTFGGHYDLAGYLVIALSLAWSYFFSLKDKLQKVGFSLLILGGFWLLILTASRISFGAYLVSLTVVCGLWAFRRGLGWAVSRWGIAVVLSILLMLSFGDLSDRFLRLVKVSDRLAGIRDVLLRPSGTPPSNKAVFLENNIAAVTSRSDQPPTPVRPADVTGKEPELLVATFSATGQRILVPRQRTYSQNALMYDLSTAIRLDETWPRAIKNFESYPLLGSGYATLTKSSKYQFTEAESTDSDYLRALGETGILGFASFYGTILLMMIIAFRQLGGVKESWLYALSAGFIGVSAGLLVNATLIDIFVSSKVAELYWGVAGLTMGSLYLFRDRIQRNYQPLQISFDRSVFWRRLVNFVKSDKLWVCGLVIVAFVLRLYKYDSPIADWHSWRQADTSAVTRNFERYHQINWLYPTFDDLSSIPSGLPNPKGLRFVEYPLYNIASYIVKNVAIELSVESAGRVTTAIFSVLGIVFIFLLSRRYLTRRIAYLSALVFAVLPYSVYYGRVVLPDPMMVTLSLSGLWFFSSYLEKEKRRYLVLAVVFSAVAILVKPFALFLLLPALYLWLVKYGFNIRKWTVLMAALAVAAAPFLLWRWWIARFPEGIPANAWLLNGDGIRFKGAFWYWLFADRMGRLILGYWGLSLLGFGLIGGRGRYRYFPVVLFLSSLAYLAVFATGNVRHDYYQILIIPALSILVGMGLDGLIFSRNVLSILLGVVSFAFMVGFGWYFVRDYYNINHPEIVEAGQKVKDLTDWRALVVAPYDGDTAFLYQTDRQGWPIVEKSMDYLISAGAQYYVSVRFDDLTKQLIGDAWPVWVKKPEKLTKVYKYKLLVYTDKYVLIQLVPDKDLPK